MSQYWYLKFNGEPIEYNGTGGFSTPSTSSWNPKFALTRTHFLSREAAREALATLTYCHSKKHIRSFKVVRVTCK